MHPIETPSFEISDFMACNVYWDLGNCPGAERQHKYLFAIAAMKDEFHPSCVKKIIVHGPGNLETEITNQFFTQEFANGYIYDASGGNYWYMKNMRNGFLEPGEYRIEVTFWNGEVSTVSHTQERGPCDELLEAYLENKERMEYYPSAALDSGTDLSRVECRWSSLKDLAGMDAYYIFRLSAVEAWWTFIQNLVFRDSPFFERFIDPDVGLNESSILIERTLQPDTVYAWWTEICDSNKIDKINLCIFQPIQTFRTPKSSE
jgi:hypothetical protein